MKAALLKAPGEVVLEEVPVPKISDDEVLVEVKYCGICGSDFRAYMTAEPYPRGTYLRHEFSGVIAKTGKNVKGWKPGDRVTVNPLYISGECYACKHAQQSQCDHGFEWAIGLQSGLEYAGAFAKFVRIPIPQGRLYSRPEEVSFEEGAMVEPLSCSLHVVKISAFRVGEHAMVLRAGLIGLGVIAHLKNAGAGLIIATETIKKG